MSPSLHPIDVFPKRFTMLLGLLWVGISCTAQLTLEPTLSLRNPVDPDSLAAFQAFAEAYDAVEALDLPLDSLTNAQFHLIRQDARRASPPWSTKLFGCSFYCNNGPEKLWSSSHLAAGSSMAHQAEKVHDWDLRTAWVEGADGAGIGESVSMRIPLKPSVFITRILITNGYTKSQNSWRDYGRVKTLALYANGRMVAELALQDSPREQAFAVGLLGAGTKPYLDLEFRILAAYPGERFPDTAISEINVDGVGHH